MWIHYSHVKNLEFDRNKLSSNHVHDIYYAVLKLILQVVVLIDKHVSNDVEVIHK